MKSEKGAFKIIHAVIIIVLVLLFCVMAFVYHNLKTQEIPTNTVASEPEVKNEVENVVKIKKKVEKVENTVEIPKLDELEATKEEIPYTDFDYKFIGLEAENNKNFVYSPLSIKYALSMLNDGAEGNTKTEIESLIDGIKLNRYKTIGNNLSLANGVFIKEDFKDSVKEDYTKNLNEKYNAELIIDSFSSANNVNKWIETKTLGIIKNLLKDDQVTRAKMILANALAIDMEWANKFDDMSTYSKEFTLDDGDVLDVAMMRNTFFTEDTKYLVDDEKSVVTIPLKEYDGTNLEFVAIKTNNDTSLDEFVKGFNKEKLTEIDENLRPATDYTKGVVVYLPRYSFDYTLSFKEDLKNLGINDAFDMEKADFSRMSDRQLYVDDAIHKADFKLSEKGVKAAAVTVFMMMENEAYEDPNVPQENH